jgi:hypothetical protein
LTARDQLRAAMALVLGDAFEPWQADALQKELWRRGLQIVDRYGQFDFSHAAVNAVDADAAGNDRARRTLPPKGAA